MNKLCARATVMLLAIIEIASGIHVVNASDKEFINKFQFSSNKLTGEENSSDSHQSFTGYGDGVIFRFNEFLRFSKSLQLVDNEICRRDLNVTLHGIAEGSRWAVRMYDASAKTVDGIESGVLYQFGHYDQCMSLSAETADAAPIYSKYCLADVSVNGIVSQDLVSRKMKQTNFTVVHWGVCVPSTCNAEDVATFLQEYLERPVAVDDKMCQVHKEFRMNDSMFVYAVVILMFIFLAFISTLYHIYLIHSRRNQIKADRSNEMMELAFISFSVIENAKKLFQASKDQLRLNSINGIKSIAMIVILAGHTLTFVYGGPLYNIEFIEESKKLPQNALLTNSLLFVDVFLLLSGFLFCRILLIELHRRQGKINFAILYIARYVRLTPAYLVMIGFQMTWFSSLADGPIWYERIEREQERCKISWWLNILYVNNYFGTDNLCMFQSWYLAVDTQLFLLAPFLIFFIYKCRKLGPICVSALFLISTAIPFAITYKKKLDPTLLVYADEVNDIASNKFYIETYIKTHMRVAPYIVGLLTGFIVHVMQEKCVKLAKPLVWFLWTLAAVIGTLSMLSITIFYSRTFTNLESALYASLDKLSWSLSVAWLVIAVTTGHAGWLQKFLGARVFAPISRLTYCAYLSNGIVELYHSSVLRSPVYVDQLSMVNYGCIHCVNTFVSALIICLIFESPIHALQRILLRKNEKSHSHSHEKSSSATPSTSEEQVA